MFYCPELGRFLSRDMIPRPGSNPYLYAGNNPSMATDPLGLQDIKTVFDQAEKAGLRIGRLREVQDTTLKFTAGDEGPRYTTLMNNLLLTKEYQDPSTKKLLSLEELGPSRTGVLFHEVFHSLWDKVLEFKDNPFWREVRDRARLDAKGFGLSNREIDYITNERLGNYIDTRVRNFLAIRDKATRLMKDPSKKGCPLSVEEEAAIKKAVDEAIKEAVSTKGYLENLTTDPAKLTIDRAGSREIELVSTWLKIDPELSVEAVLRSAGFKLENRTWLKPAK